MAVIENGTVIGVKWPQAQKQKGKKAQKSVTIFNAKLLKTYGIC